MILVRFQACDRMIKNSTLPLPLFWGVSKRIARSIIATSGSCKEETVIPFRFLFFAFLLSVKYFKFSNSVSSYMHSKCCLPRILHPIFSCLDSGLYSWNHSAFLPKAAVCCGALIGRFSVIFRSLWACLCASCSFICPLFGSPSIILAKVKHSCRQSDIRVVLFNHCKSNACDLGRCGPWWLKCTSFLNSSVAFQHCHIEESGWPGCVFVVAD